MESKQFGPAWEAQLMKLGKKDLAQFFGVSGAKISKKEQISLIKQKLIAQYKRHWET